MLCGNAAMEDIAAVTKSTATLFQMQQATNISKPLPFPTVRETEVLEKAYDSAATRGRQTQTAITALMLQTGVGAREIRAWFSDARKARGHSTPSDAQSREAPASIEVRTRHPTSSSGTHPTSTYVPPREEEDTGSGQSRLYGRAGTPMIDLQNIALTDPTEEASIPSDGEDKLVIVLGDE